jgi:hypothetical protein
MIIMMMAWLQSVYSFKTFKEIALKCLTNFKLANWSQAIIIMMIISFFHCS